MALNKLGNYIELREIRNTYLTYGESSVRGVNTSKIFMPTRVDLSHRDLSKFQIVSSGDFVFNHRTSRNGSKLSIAYNDADREIICTEDYVVFCIREDCRNQLLPEWLYMFFNRPEFDRYAITNSWGSSTEFFNWEDMCDIDIELPSLPIQQKYVNIYNAMLANQRSYERGLDDLKLSIDAVIEQFKHTASRTFLGELIDELDNRNTDGRITYANGVNKDKQFMPSVASGADLTKYKTVGNNQFACNLMHVGRDVAVPVALNTDEEPLIVSPAYIVFEAKHDEILPEFLLSWLSRTETDRYAWFMSDTNVRSGMEKKRFYELDIPTPPIAEQEALVKMHKAYALRREINEKLQAQIKSICPILIKGSLEEGQSL